MAKNNPGIDIMCIKYLLFCLTLIFALTSASTILVGTMIYSIYCDVPFLEDRLFVPATLIIAIGVIMLFVSLFGCIGALKESTCLVNIFAVILTLVLVLEIAAAIVAYTLRSQVLSILEHKLRDTLPYYYSYREIANGFDFIQSRLNCCGVNSYEDWGAVQTFTSGIHIGSITVPYSCCAKTLSQVLGVIELEICKQTYARGCLPRITNLVYENIGLLGAGVIILVFIQITGIMISFSLAGSIRKAKTERECRKWENKERMINARNASLNPDNEKAKFIEWAPTHKQITA